MIRSATVTPGLSPQRIEIGAYVLAGDTDAGGTAPSPHDYFDAALASCTSETAHWYAERHKIPLERCETEVVRDTTQERAGVYKLRVSTVFHGPISDEQRAVLIRAVAACPIHKLMTTTEIVIESV